MIACCGAMIAAIPTSPPACSGAGAGDRRANAGQQRDDRCRLRGGKLFAQSLQVTASKVSGLVGKDANDFVRGLGVEQRAGIDEDMPAIHHEGVERAVAKDHDPHILLCKSRRPQDRLRIVAQQLLDLGVTNDRHPTRRAVLSACGCDRRRCRRRPR